MLKVKDEKLQKTKSMDLKMNLFGSGDLKQLWRKSGHMRNKNKKDDYMFLDYTRNIKTRQNKSNCHTKGKTL